MKLLVFQHAPTEHPGSLRDLMRADGMAWDTVHLDAGAAIPSLEGYDALLVLGGPMDVWEEDAHPWLRAEKTAIRDWVAAERPFLGICLGHQLLAEAMGGQVGPMPRPEVGVGSVSLTPEGAASPLFSGAPASLTVLQWHGAQVRQRPAGATVLAHNDHCAIQALQVGARAFGIQYHVEATASTAEDWGAIPEYRAALEAITGPGGQAWLEAQVSAEIDTLRAAAAQLYANFRRVMGAAG